MKLHRTVPSALVALAVAVAAGLGACERASDAAPPAASAAGSASNVAAGSASSAPPASPGASQAVAPAPPADRLVIVAGGDVNLGRGLGAKLWRGEDVDVFENIQPVLKSGDVRFVNLESQLSDQDGETQSPRNRLVFTGPPQGADLLARAGINLVSLANNHMWDYGQRALVETIGNLRRVGIAHAGATDQWDQGIYEPAVLRINGWSVALFAVTDIWNQGAFEEHRAAHFVAWARFDILPKIRAARAQHDIVLVSYHSGAEYMDIPMAWTRQFVKAAMRAGADAVFGHHPHVPHGVGWFDGRPAFTSLGNLVFHMHRDYPWTGTSYLARLTFRRAEGAQRLSVEACPYHILGVTPMLFEGKTRVPRERAFRKHLQHTSITVGKTEVGEAGQYSCVRLAPPAARQRQQR